MIPQTETTIAHVGTATEVFDMKIAQGVEAHVLRLLTNLYSRVQAALVREYSTNARDSHIFAGKADVPIKVTLPTYEHLSLVIQDFGLGLNVNGLREVYSQYGASTKRESDEVNGVLGIGCKSALAYADQFSVEGVLGGVKTLAVVTKNSSGVGVIKILDTVTTSEPNGVKVSIPVKSEDVNRFANEAADLFKFWEKGTVLVNGAEPANVRDDKDLIWLDEDVAVRIGYSTQDTIVMGNVPYPVANHKREYRKGCTGGYQIIAWLPMNTVQFTPSREALEFTTQTQETVDTLWDYASEALAQSIERRLADLDPWDKIAACAEWGNFAPLTKSKIEARYGSYLPLGGGDVFRVYQGSARKVGALPWSAIREVGNIVLVSGFPLRSVSPLVKERLVRYTNASGVNTRNAYLLPTSANLRILQGHMEIISWDDIVAATPTVKAERAKNQGKTKYAVKHNGRLSLTAEIGEYDNDPVLFYIDLKYGAPHAAALYQQAHVVGLAERQVAKFQRLYPQAQSVHEYHNAQIKATKAALTKADGFQEAVRDFQWAFLAPLVDQVKDPALRKVLTAINTPQSEAYKAHRRISGGTYLGKIEPLPLDFAVRYPLVASRFSSNDAEECVLYINAKFQSLKSNRKAH